MKKTLLLITMLTSLILFISCEPAIDPIYSITLSQVEDYDFPSETNSNYTAIDPLTVTITNTGNQPAEGISISIDGASGSSFTLSKTKIDTIGIDESDSFTITPNLALAKGDYQANVHVSGKNIPEQSFAVRFVISDLLITEIKITSQPTQTEYGVGEPFNVDGLVVTAVGPNNVETPLEITADSEYLVYDFSSPSAKDEEGNMIPSKVQITVGSAPVKEIEVYVLSISDRVKAANGKTATIILYADEKTMDANMVVNTAGSDITITTQEDITKPVILKRSGTGSVLYLNGTSTAGDIKVTLDGYVTIQGRASSAFGGTDETNNTNQAVLVSKASLLTMKGHSKITGNAKGNENVGGGVYISNYGEMVMTENSSVTNCSMVSITGTGSIYGGAFYLYNYAKLTLKDNAKITGNRTYNALANAYGGAIFLDQYCELRIEGGEISDNTAESGAAVAGGGALMLTNASAKTYISGGVIKNNIIKYKTQGRGGAICVGSSTKGFHLSGNPTIEPKSDGSVSTSGDITTNTMNTIAITEYGYINILGTLSNTIFPNLDLQYSSTPWSFSTPIMRKYTVVEGENIYENFITDAPADKFTLNNLVQWSSPFSVTSLSTKKIDVNGKVVNK